MSESPTPIVEDRCVCIVTREDLALAVIICGYFGQPGQYLAVFEFPTLDFPYTGASESEGDRYYARVLAAKYAEHVVRIGFSRLK
jgi:hypothetical protein